MKKRTLDMMIGIFLSIFLVLIVICLVRFTREKLGKKDPILETEESYQTDTEIYEDEINSELFGTELWDSEVTEIEVEGSELSEEELAMLESEETEKESEKEESKKDDSQKEETKKEDSKKEKTESEKNSEKQEVTKPKYPYYIKVNRQANCVTVYTYDENGKYTVPVKAMVCSTGRNKGTPTGVFRTQAKYTWRILYGNVYGQYSTRINGSILFHSVPYRKTQKNSLITNYYNQLGTAASAGCVRLTCADAKWIYDNCALGTTVEVYDGSSPGPLGKPSAVKIDKNHPNAGWDPTDPDPNNPWRKQAPTLSGVKASTVERGGNVDLLSGVLAVDSAGNSVNVNVSGTVNTKVCGDYTITYSATDSSGNTTTAKAVVTVKDTVAPSITQTSVITVHNSTTDIEKLIKSALRVTDAGETLDTSVITLDISNLKNAMNKKSYGTIKVSASAVDAYGNKTTTSGVEVTYVQVDENAPVITITGNAPTASVDLTNVKDEATRKSKIVTVAKNAVQKGTNYTVKDDFSKENEIECSLSCDYQGNTLKGNYSVKVIITAKDKAGKAAQKDIMVSVAVIDNTDENAPVITITGNTPTVSVDLTNVKDEATRKSKIVTAVKGAVRKGTHYTVKDDVSKENEIECSISCNYQGSTLKGNYSVEVIITAKDEAGKTSQKDIVVSLTVVDNTVIQQPDGTQNPGNQGTQGTEQDTSGNNLDTEASQNIEEHSETTEELSPISMYYMFETKMVA